MGTYAEQCEARAALLATVRELNHAGTMAAIGTGATCLECYQVPAPGSEWCGSCHGEHAGRHAEHVAECAGTCKHHSTCPRGTYTAEERAEGLRKLRSTRSGLLASAESEYAGTPEGRAAWRTEVSMAQACAPGACTCPPEVRCPEPGTTAWLSAWLECYAVVLSNAQ